VSLCPRFINFPLRGGYTALHSAVVLNASWAIDALLKNGADKDIKDDLEGLHMIFIKKKKSCRQKRRMRYLSC